VKRTVIYIGPFKLPAHDAGAVRVCGLADALGALRYKVLFIGDEYRGPAATDSALLGRHRAAIALKRGVDQFLRLSSYRGRLECLDWTDVAAVICYPGSAALIWHLIGLCRKHQIPLVIDCTEWYDATHVAGGRCGPLALDSAIRMRWLNVKAQNVICVSSFLARYYGGKGCNVVRIPPLVGSEGNRLLPKLVARQRTSTNALTLVYAGFPGRKERFAEIIAGVQSSRRNGIDVSLTIVGTTQRELSGILRRDGCVIEGFDGIICHGRLRRDAALQIVAASDFTVLLRAQKRFANAGFPSKLVESLSLGVPVMANPTSDIAEYLKDGRDSLLLDEPNASALERAIARAAALNSEERSQMRTAALVRANECFDYRQYVGALADFLASARLCR